MNFTATLAALSRRIDAIAAQRLVDDDKAELAVRTVKAMDDATLLGVVDRTLLPPIWWEALKPHAVQQALWQTGARYVTVPAGRRAGKTLLAKRRLVREAIKPQQYDDAWYIAAAPTHTQAKRIFWKHLKRMVPEALREGRPMESELTINLWNGASITVMGMDVPERAEGGAISGGVLDEYGNMAPKVWPEHVRPATSDRRGWMWFTGVPEGRNHYYDLHCDFRSRAAEGCATFTWPSADILPPEEIAQAKRDLDELTFKQEYEASFVTFEGLAYYTWDTALNTGYTEYDPKADLILCFDFNVAPGVAVAVQERPDRTDVIGEVYIPRNSNTPLVCAKIAEVWGKHIGDVYCYGDATGGSKGTAKVAGSDWDLIKATLRPVYGDRLHFRVPEANGPERARVNAVNTRIKTADGSRRLRVNASTAPFVVKDFEGVRTLEGGTGEIDKHHDAKLTHLTDALGYYIVKRWPIVKHVVNTSSSY